MTGEYRSNINPIFRSKFSEDIFNLKYRHDNAESWDELARTVAIDVCGMYLQKSELEELTTMIRNQEFLPGGRYLYYAGRPNRFYNNCFLLKAEEDTREDWASLAWRSISCLMTGGGIGVDYSVYRPAGASLSNDGNNRVVTGDGSGGLNGEANLTFDGNALIVAGTAPSITIGDAGAEDTKIVFDGNALDFHIGLDDSADTLNIGKGSALGTTTAMTFDTNGIIKTPLQPMFQAYASSNQSISDYSDHFVNFGGEDFDIGSNFASNTFTAPVAGKYAFFVKLSIEGLGDWVKVKLVPTGKQYQTQETAAAYHLVGFSVIVDMAASDTAKVQIVANDNSYTIIGDSGSTYHQSTFSGFLLG